MVNSRDKGKNGEREAAKIFSNVFGGSFTRVPSSGGFVGGKNNVRLSNLSETQGRAFRGDIIPPDFLPNLFLEIKSYLNFRFHQLMQPQGCSILDSWIKQTLDGVKSTDVWFVCFKATKLGWYIVVPESECSVYKFGNYCSYKSAHGQMRVTDLIEFLNNNSAIILDKAGVQTNLALA